MSVAIPGLVEQKTPFSAAIGGQTLYFEDLATLKTYMQGRQATARPQASPAPLPRESATPHTPADAAPQSGHFTPATAPPRTPTDATSQSGHIIQATTPHRTPTDATPQSGHVTHATAPHRTPTDVLRTLFGYPAFRNGQAEVIDALLAGQSAVAIMPTGAGKSVCFQVPALLLPGLTIVVSPLIALMKDQVEALLSRGIAATLLNSQVPADETRRRLDGLRQGRYKLVYIAPERFANAPFLAALKGTRVSLFAVDEAHCISEWGHNFRPHYLQLSAAIQACGNPPVLAATATATPEVREDIIRQLGLVNPRVLVTGFNRPNLGYTVRRVMDKPAKFKAAEDLVFATPGPVVVYASNRRDVEAFAAKLRASGAGARAYHAGLPDELRNQAQDEFMAGRARVIVATNAFGMGVDKPDVRLVLHLDLPKSLEAYYQEAGRAGRDGAAASCALFFCDEDERVQRFLIEANYPDAGLVRKLYGLLKQVEPHEQVSVEALWSRFDKAVKLKDLELALDYLCKERLVQQTRHEGQLPSLHVVDAAADPLPPDQVDRQRRRRGLEIGRLDRVVAFARAQTCRRANLLSYFGETERPQCNNCDLCLRPKGFVADLVKLAQTSLPKRTAPASQPAVPAFEGEFNRRRVECPYCRGKVLDEELTDHCELKHGKPPPVC